METSIHAHHRERVKKRFLEQGAGSFELHQLIELLLFFGIPRRDTNVLAHVLANRYGSMTALLDAPHEELLRVEGMTHSAAVLITLCKQLTVVCEKERYTAVRVLNSTFKMEQFVLPMFTGCRNEQVVLVCMDNQWRVLSSSVLTEGSVNATEINIRKVTEQALRCNATKVLIAHNHPGGAARPSREDVETTRALIGALSIMEIQLADHLVVAGGKAISMKGTALYTPLFLGQKAGRQDR